MKSRSVEGAIVSRVFSLVIVRPLASLALLFLVLSPLAASAAPETDTKSHPQVYLFRGLANIFSYGMDTLADKITAAGVPAKAYNHSAYPQVVKQITDAYRADPNGSRPIVLIGHSLGANAVLVMGQQLGAAGVPVDLIVTFDPTIGTPISSNVRRYLNLYETHDYWGVPLPGGDGKRIVNSDIRNRKDLNVSTINHGNIDKDPVLHAQVVSEILKLTGRKPAKRKHGASKG